MSHLGEAIDDDKDGVEGVGDGELGDVIPRHQRPGTGRYRERLKQPVQTVVRWLVALANKACGDESVDKSCEFGLEEGNPGSFASMGAKRTRYHFATIPFL